MKKIKKLTRTELLNKLRESTWFYIVENEASWGESQLKETMKLVDQYIISEIEDLWVNIPVTGEIAAINKVFSETLERIRKGRI